jgi:hypothetical protein
MMDRFFESEPMDSHTDPNFVMKRFFYRYSELLAYVRRTHADWSEERTAAIRQKERQTAKWMDSPSGEISNDELAAEKQYRYLCEQRKMDHAVGLLTLSELEESLRNLTNEYQASKGHFLHSSSPLPPLGALGNS